jgi:Cdc6-like AAA superfamily ATPase
MKESEIESIQACFMQFNRRAEKVSDEILAKTFVDAAPLLVQLSTRNNQVLYGRRGTGKTHALKYLADRNREAGGFPIYIDLRTIGSNGSIYGDQQKPLSERATQLILDVLEAMESELMQIALQRIDDAPDRHQVTMRLDDLSRAIRDVAVRDPAFEREVTDTSKKEKEREGGLR